MSLILVKSKGSILQYLRPSLSYHLSVRSSFCLFLSGRFTPILLYVLNSLCCSVLGEKFNTKVDKGKLAQMLSELVQQLTRKPAKTLSETD